MRRCGRRLDGGRLTADGSFGCLFELVQRAFAVDRGLTICEEGFPWHTLRIGDPLLVGSGVAAGGALLLDSRTFGTHKALVDLREFRFVLGLNAEMRDTDNSAGALAEREIDPRVVEYPLRIVVLDDGRFGREQSRIEPDRWLKSNPSLNFVSFSPVPTDYAARRSYGSTNTASICPRSRAMAKSNGADPAIPASIG